MHRCASRAVNYRRDLGFKVCIVCSVRSASRVLFQRFPLCSDAGRRQGQEVSRVLLFGSFPLCVSLCAFPFGSFPLIVSLCALAAFELAAGLAELACKTPSAPAL